MNPAARILTDLIALDATNRNRRPRLIAYY